MKFALCQMDVLQGKIEDNRTTALAMIREAAKNGADAVVLPEMWTSGYDFARLQEHAETLTGTTCTLLSNLAKELKIWIVGGSLPIRFSEGVSNTAVTFNPNGELLHTYRKIHLIGLMDEDKFLAAGDSLSCFDLSTKFSNDTFMPERQTRSEPAGDSVPAATIICYDLRFPELSRGAVQMGAKILFVPAEWPVQRQLHWHALLQARAIENQMYVAAVNISGENQNDKFAGGSKIINPWGDVVAEAGTDPQVLYADVDLKMVDEVRERVPSLRDRKPAVYTKL